MSSNRKLEIRTRMAELQREFSSLNDEIKEMETEDKATRAREKFKDYKFKVGTYGYVVDPEDKVLEADDSDRENAATGKSGLIYSGFSHSSNYGYILLKERSDYARAVRITQIIDAVEHIGDEKVKDKEPYIKIVLGVTTAMPKEETCDDSCDGHSH